MYTSWWGSADDPIWIQPDWPRHLVRGLFSFRQGGGSAASSQPLNVGLLVGDDLDHVLANRQVCAARIGSDLADWVVGRQVHGDHVAVVTQHDRGRGAVAVESTIPDTDALVTDVPGLTLVVLAADCVPLLFWDPVRRAVGAAHSGWQGTVKHIARRVIEAMGRAYHSRPQDLRVWIGPSIRRCCYEVDERVADPVVREFGQGFLLPRHGRTGKYWLGLQQCIRADLLQAGVDAANIHDTGVCTACNVNVLFSHRREGGRTGRMLAAVRLVDGRE